ncbi:MAG: hypothetical protein ACYS5V_02620, partial [Planctomycetota bacterium]|jgi:hypothetical protein
LLTGGHEWGFRLYWLTLWALGGLGVLLLARHLGAPAWAACVGAVAFMFSGPYTGHAEHTSWIESISFLPWIIWRLDVAVARRKLLPAAQAGALWGLSALAGYPGLTMITAGFGGMWVLGRTVFPTTPELPASAAKPWRSWKRSAGAGLRRRAARVGMTAGILALFAVLGIAVLAPTFVGFMVESKGYSDRSGVLPRERAIGSNALHPGALVTHASPAAAVLNLRRELWPYTDVSSCSVYTGPIVLALAATALILGRRNGFRWWLLALGVLALTAAMGRALPVRGWLYDLLPPTRYFRHAVGFRIYWVFALVMLAMTATADLATLGEAEARKAWRCMAAGSLGAALLAGLATVLLLWQAPATAPRPPLTMAHLLAVWGLWPVAAWFGARKPARLLPCLLIALTVIDAVLTVEVSRSTMYVDRDEGWREAERRHVASLDLTERGLRRGVRCMFPWHINNKNLLAKEPVLLSYAPITRNLLFKGSIRHPVLGPSALSRRRSGRTWFCPYAPRVKPTERGFRHLAWRSAALGRPVLVVTEPEDMIAGPTAWRDEPVAFEGVTAAVPQAVKVWRHEPDELGFDADCPGDGWLLVTDRWSRSWRVTVSGRPGKVWAGNFVFRAVKVARGRNRVHFTFRPPGHGWMLAGSWGTLALVGVVSAGAAARGMFRKRRGQASD